MGAPNAGGVGKNYVFLPVATVVCVRHGALAEEYAISSATLVVVEIWWSQLRSSYGGVAYINGGCSDHSAAWQNEQLSTS